MHGPKEQHLRLTSHRLMYVHPPKQGHIHTLNICTYIQTKEQEWKSTHWPLPLLRKKLITLGRMLTWHAGALASVPSTT